MIIVRSPRALLFSRPRLPRFRPRSPVSIKGLSYIEN